MLKSGLAPLMIIVCLAELVSGGLFGRRTVELAGRQAGTLEPSEIPSQCDSICAPYFADSQRCGTLNTACLCTSSVRDDGVNCANCIASIFPSELGALQAGSDAAVQGCAQHGDPIDPIKLTGISPSAGSVSVPAVASNTAAGSALPAATTSAGGSTKTGDAVRIISLSIPGLAVAFGISIVTFYI